MKEKTKTWLEIAENDLEFAKSILRHKDRPHYAVHYCHQAIEKILKALVQEFTDETPKRTHNFKMLCEQCNVAPSPDIEQFLIKLGPHYLASRYPEDMAKLYKEYHEDYVKKLLKETEGAFQWFKQKLVSKK